MDQRRSLASRSWFVPALLVLASAAFFRRFLVSADVIPGYGDVYRQYYPWRWFEQLTNHAAWLPYSQSGEPIFANIQVLRWYPIDQLLEALLPLPAALNVTIFVHVTICALALYWLLRSEIGSQSAAALGAVAFAFGGYVIAQMYAGHITVIAAVAWLPIVFGLGKRAIDNRRPDFAMLAAGAYGMQILAGHPQTSFLTGALLAAWALMASVRCALERSWKPAVAVLATPVVVAALGAGIAGVVLIPTGEFAALSTRAGGVSFQFATIYQLPWYSLSSLLLPNLLGTPLNNSDINFGPYWEFALYMGLLPLAFVAAAIRLHRSRLALFLAVIALGATVLALGSATPAFGLIWELVPGVSSFRVPARFLLLTTFAMTVLAAIGFARTQQPLDRVERRFIKWMGIVCLGAGLIGLSAGIVVRAQSSEILAVALGAIERIFRSQAVSRFPLDYYQERLPRLIDTAAIDSLVTGGLLVSVSALLFWRSRTETAPRTYVACALALVTLDLGVHQQPFVRTRPVAPLHRPPDFLLPVLDDPITYRVWDPDGKLDYNLQIFWGLQTLEGYNPLRLDHIHEALLALRRQPIEQSKGFLAVMGARWVVAERKPEVEWIEPVARFGDVWLFQNRAALRKAFLVDPNELGLRASDPLERGGIARTASDEGVELIRFEPDLIEVSAQVSGVSGRALVLSELTYPGWNVTVDGMVAEPREAYGLLRAVMLQPGVHRVVWRFEPRSARTGLAVTVAASVVWLILAGLFWGRQRRARM